MGILKIKVVCFLIIVGCFPLINYAQDNIKVDSINIELLEKKAIIGVWPSKVNTVNGIMFNFWSKNHSTDDLLSGKVMYPTTNGIEFNLNPAVVLMAMLALPYIIMDKSIREPYADSTNIKIRHKYKQINGLQIAFLNLEPTKMNGVEVHLFGNFGSIVNGVSLGFILNHRLKLNGVGIGLENFDTEVKGVQLGLFNTALHLKGIQIGLWNKNEKRSLPFINWNL